jgi:predicted transposase YdaD
MSKPFDATLKEMLEESPGDWPALVGLPEREAEVINADVSTVTSAADKVLRVRGSPPWIMHLEPQGGRDPGLPRRMYVDNALLENRHKILVRSVAVLLSPKANHPNLTGTYRRQFRGEPPYLTFRYEVIRVWQLPVERLLTGGLDLLPLAPISAVRKTGLPGVLERMKQRLSRERPKSAVGDLWTATSVLMGLRYKATLVRELLRGVENMEESVTYRAIKREGAKEGATGEARRVLLLLGREQFGQETPEVTQALEAITSVKRLEQLSVRLLKVGSWRELLELPRGQGQRRRR